ncbi:MAG TPA: hypothetical protein VKW08_11620 [Xanthobacteraceae bacterium]|nr:hypothetical protein [Xanthobacteraceae bacterium]
MIQILLGGLALALTCLPAFAGSAVADNSRPATMRFEWHQERPAGSCGKICRTWISAVGPITERTPDDFAAFAAQSDLHGATLVLDSVGGSVVGTIRLGHMLRDLDITTTVGTTVTSTAPDGLVAASVSHAASCESMCGFVLLGGLHRYVPPEARVLVHQIWLSKKRTHPETASYNADEIALVERDIGSLASYTIEMGGGIELLQAALRVPPWEPLHRLTDDEVQAMHLSNVDHLFDVQPTQNVAKTVGAAGDAFASAPLP